MEHGCWKMRTMLEITIVDWKRILVFLVDIDGIECD